MARLPDGGSPRERAEVSLQGLSVGDAFGEKMLWDILADPACISRREAPVGQWRYTDDTQMALSVVEVLLSYGTIDQDALAASFAERFHRSPNRGYGSGVYTLLTLLRGGDSWRQLSRNQFGGQGSYGNGSAMRVAPLGAWFADDLDAVVTNAARSAEVTHSHAEGIAGAIAVAVAAAIAWQMRRRTQMPSCIAFIDAVLPYVPQSVVREGIERSRELSDDLSTASVARILGSGQQISCQDTVPFTIWCAARYLDDFETAIWETISGGGDRDTTCAIVGGIVACATGLSGIPEIWLIRRETLPSVVKAG